MSAMLGDCAQGWWPTKISVPVRAHITDIRVVRFHNYSRFAIYLMMTVGFLFYFDWTSPSSVRYEYNAWLDAPLNRSDTWMSGAGVAEPMCDNPDYDYIYDAFWTYENMACKRLSPGEAFAKSIGGNTFWVNTLLVEKNWEICDPTTKKATLANDQTCDARDMYDLGTKLYLVEGLDDMLMTLTIFAESVGYYGYNSKKPSDERVSLFIHTPGWITDPDNHLIRVGEDLRLQNSAFGLRMSLAKWMLLFNTNLDDVYENAGTAVSEGLARNRIVGLRLTVGVELRNREEGMFFARWPMGDLEMHLYLSTEQEWTRNVIGYGPGRTVNEMKATDAYGVRIKMLARDESNLRVPDPASFVRSLLDLVVFLIVFKAIIRAFALFALGTTSHKWRRALNMNVETHVLMSRDGKHRIRLRGDAIEKADSILVQLGNLLIKHTNIDHNKLSDDDIRKYVFTKQETKRMYNLLDIDGNGQATEEEIKEVLERYKVAFTQLEIDCVMGILDRNGNGVFDCSEFSKSIGRALVKAKLRRIAGKRKQEKAMMGAGSKDQMFERALTSMLEDDAALSQMDKKQRQASKVKLKSHAMRRMTSSLSVPSTRRPNSSRRQQGSSKERQNRQVMRTPTVAKKKRSMFDVEAGHVGTTMSL